MATKQASKVKQRKSQTQLELAYQTIRKSILDLVFPPGYPLSEADIAEQLNMSRTPVREAFRLLENNGLIETYPQKGATVRGLWKDDIQQIYETAEGLEGMVVYLVTANHNEEDIEKLLGRDIEALEQALQAKDHQSWVEADESFHIHLHSLCNNVYLKDYLSRLNDHIHRVRLITAPILDMNQSTQDHRAVYEAIRNGDADLARELTQRHWSLVRERSIKVISHW